MTRAVTIVVALAAAAFLCNPVVAQELAPHGVTVNAVCPGAIATEAHKHIPRATLDALVAATPAGFIATPAEVGGLVAYLASDEARFITGQTIAINGGRNMI